MNVKKVVVKAMATFILLHMAPAEAGPRSISATIDIVAPAFERIKFPVVGEFGNVSLTTIGDLPGLSRIKIPVVGGIAGIPVIGGLTVAKGVQIMQSVVVLQAPLPGLGVIDTALAKFIKK